MEPQAIQNIKSTIGIQTLGCRLNQFESDGLLQKFIDTGRYSFIEIEQGPDIAIINTCTVTEQADQRNKQFIQKLLKKNPDCKIIITGCYAQTDPDKVDLPGVTMVVSNEKKSSLLEIFEDSLKQKKVHKVPSRINQIPILENPFGYDNVLPQNRTRAFLKIQDGCNKTCSYCKIPQARGLGVSRPVHEIIEHVKILESLKVPEIVLTGVNLGWYREKNLNTRFAALLEKILNHLSHSRLRLSSIEPCDVDRALAELSTHPRFCNFLHVPLQSGSDNILRKMRRSYTAFSFSKRLDLVRKYNPNIFLGTDLILGFPGERQEDFEETLTLCRENEISGLHAFRYSERPGTRASLLYSRELEPNLHTVHLRMKEVQKLRFDLWAKYVKKQNQTFQIAVIEGVNKGDAGTNEISGLTDNYIKVFFETHSINFKKGDLIRVYFENTLPPPLNTYRVKVNLDPALQ